ncbi:helicase C-terminal domain-containing protein [Marispirochaeta aestuarii]|uniref:ATP-dependent DNA helicase n=1 Tax=Marispirochaeta aestuarii TaxID=1963862 RepID=UPI0029C9A086|nr:helicase C-terminal domain-containing protein [Marispirochaeta aestuarii]
MRIQDYFLPHIVDNISDAVAEASGNEVFFIGTINDEGLVSSVMIGARGNRISVPALSPFLETADVVIHNHPSGNLTPSSADLGIASYLGNRGVGFYIIDNQVSDIYVVSEAVRESEISPLDSAMLTGLLLPEGPLAEEIRYEKRDSQIAMVEEVCRSFNENDVSLIEAGTGVGKSFAYLVPAIAWAEKNRQRVVISTGTINLQNQLLDKDIPTVLKIMKSRVSCALVKGRGNYLCLHRLNEALEEDSLFREEGHDLESIREWAGVTETGSLSDLPILPPRELWNRINSEADSCLGLRCRHRENCFVIRARRKAAAAQVLVVNHHLLFSDLALRLEELGFEGTAVLPPFHKIVFDEAHNVERNATSYFSMSLGRLSIYKQLSRLLRRRRNRSFGALVKIESLVPDTRLSSQAPQAIGNLRETLEAAEAAILPLMSGASSYRLRGAAVHGAEEGIDLVVSNQIAEIRKPLGELYTLLGRIAESLPDDAAEEPALHELKVIQRRLSGFLMVCDSFRERENRPDQVFWIEAKRIGRETHLFFTVSPLEVSSLMREAVYDPFDTVIMTSATLTIQENFRYWEDRMGLTEYPHHTGRFPSPFPYRSNVLLCVPQEAPDPKEPDYIDFSARLARDLLLLSEGRGLLLFTSYAMLKEVHDFLAPPLEEAGISVLRQGDDDRTRLLERFNSDTGSVLLATESFWEGVDSPGETLTLLILFRLPFTVPSDPVLQARMEAVEARGGNSFFQLSLPMAVMRFKQGFGRLIRSSSDRGAVVICDPRILKKNYGGVFLDSLPATRRCFGTRDTILRELESFLYSRET